MGGIYTCTGMNPGTAMDELEVDSRRRKGKKNWPELGRRLEKGLPLENRMDRISGLDCS
jgi:hypothetical protein